MTRYLMIESLDPFDSADTTNFAELAETLARAGHAVTFFLIQNAVMSARHGAKPGPFTALAAKGVEILADEFSLRERGISSNQLVAGVKLAPLDVVVDQLADGCKALWH